MINRVRLPLLGSGLFLLCLALLAAQVSQVLPWQEWLASLRQPSQDDYRQLLIWYSLLPR